MNFSNKLNPRQRGNLQGEISDGIANAVVGPVAAAATNAERKNVRRFI